MSQYVDKAALMKRCQQMIDFLETEEANSSIETAKMVYRAKIATYELMLSSLEQGWYDVQTEPSDEYLSGFVSGYYHGAYNDVKTATYELVLEIISHSVLPEDTNDEFKRGFDAGFDKAQAR
jgi:hypothetical protein